MTGSSELYACLYVKEFPAQALLRLQPQLRESACVVMQGQHPQQVVCSLNTKARLLGLRHGMTHVEVETFPPTRILTRSTQAESGVKAILLECAGAYSPRVEDRSLATSFLCGIDIAGTQSLFGPPELLAKSLLQRVRSLGLSGHLTISCNFQTAVCLAKGLSPQQAWQVVRPGKEAATLALLPLKVLDLTEAQAATFSMWGVHTLGMLAALPENELISRLGQQGKRLRQLAGGTHQHLLQPANVPFTLEERAELDHPLDNLDSLLFGVGVMLEQLILRASARVYVLASVSITLHLDTGATHSRTISPRVPSSDKHLWLKLLHLDLQAHPPQAAILAVVLRAEPGVATKVQLGLFSPQLPEPGRLDVTLARISALVGDGNVGRAVLDDTHAPHGFHMEPFSLALRDAALISSPPHACLRNLQPPERSVVTLQQGRPQLIQFRNQRYSVEHAYGPWISGGEWWAADAWRHEQWDLIARAQEGTLLYCCVLRDLVENLWQVVALYD